MSMNQPANDKVQENFYNLSLLSYISFLLFFFVLFGFFNTPLMFIQVLLLVVHKVKLTDEQWIHLDVHSGAKLFYLFVVTAVILMAFNYQCMQCILI